MNAGGGNAAPMIRGRAFMAHRPPGSALTGAWARQMDKDATNGRT